MMTFWSNVVRDITREKKSTHKTYIVHWKKYVTGSDTIYVRDATSEIMKRHGYLIKIDDNLI